MKNTTEVGIRIAELELQLSSLRSREQELTDYIENGSIGMHWVAADGTILWANQAELDLLGYQKSEYIGHHIAEFHADETVIQDILQRLLGKETLRNYEARLRCKDGSARHVVINSNALWDGERFVHTRCFTRDVTDRKQEEEKLVNAHRMLEQLVMELRAKDELFRIALGKSQIVIFYQDTELRYKWVYNAFPQHQSVSLIDKLDSQLFAADEAEQLNRLKRTVLSSGIGIRQEVTLTTEGQSRIMDETLEPFRDSSGEIVGLLGTAVDVTDRKLNEEHFRNSRQQLRTLAARMQSQREEERALTSFEIHDLAQLLTGLALRLDLLADDRRGQTAPGSLAGSLKELSELLVSTIESSTKLSTELRPSLLDTMGVAVAIDWYGREFAARTGIRVIPDMPDRVSLDPEVATSVFRILQRILMNVERHAQAKEVLISLRHQVSGLFLQVRDDGRGITNDEIADPKSLGLLEMRELALMFGGDFYIQRNPHRGTTVTVTIPEQAGGSTGMQGYQRNKVLLA